MRVGTDTRSRARRGSIRARNADGLTDRPAQANATEAKERNIKVRRPIEPRDSVSHTRMLVELHEKLRDDLHVDEIAAALYTNNANPLHVQPVGKCPGVIDGPVNVVLFNAVDLRKDGLCGCVRTEARQCLAKTADQPSRRVSNT